MDYKRIIRAYVKGEEPFEERNQYLGMEASTIPELFLHFFAAQSPEDRRGLADTLVSGAVGNAEIDADECGSLILRLCWSGYGLLFRQHTGELESAVRHLLSSWLATDDDDPAKPDPRTRWHFGLKLHAVLLELGSAVAGWMRNEALIRAKSLAFREGLTQQFGMSRTRGE